MTDFFITVESFFKSAQQTLCTGMELADGKATFQTDTWVRPEGGGGITRIIKNGGIFEKGGINFSSVSGELPPSISERLQTGPDQFHACGISLVLHPENPFIPTIHANFRYFETDHGPAWFGGGIDLTPWYPFRDDVVHFHQTLKSICDRFHPDWYPKYKAWCDGYFFLKHRQECRGVGGLFFDQLSEDPETTFSFIQALAGGFTSAYLPLVEKRRSHPFGEKERWFHEVMRGRYVEFNLIYDKGTLFGLETNGRVESIFMSLPPRVRWEYNYSPEPGSPEAERSLFVQPQDWV